MFRFVIRRSVDNQYYWEIVAANNQVLAVSETYVSKQGAQNAIAAVKASAANAPVVDQSTEPSRRSLP
jgi:uncharacterized protein YegP (UPF0339 family)